tara:strand:- start:782 stop:1033 length:252 start_codon:yes stop_codon:yes gene_type:complete
MNNTNTGGSAFPISGAQYRHTEGMTLRDFLAAKAMQGFISAKAWHPDFIYPDDFPFVAGERAADEVAVSSYKYADAMLKARKL